MRVDSCPDCAHCRSLDHWSAVDALVAIGYNEGGRVMILCIVHTSGTTINCDHGTKDPL